MRTRDALMSKRRPGLSLLESYRSLVDQKIRDGSAFEFAIAVAFLEGASRMRDRFVKRGRRKS